VPSLHAEKCAVSLISTLSYADTTCMIDDGELQRTRLFIDKRARILKINQFEWP